MKTLKLSIALIICAAAVSSCKDDAMVSASDAERTGISRAPQHGDYSWYIISPDEAIDMVVKDLKKSGGEFAKKQISHVEPVMIEGIQKLVNPELLKYEFIAASDPAFYIVHFKDEGYALVNPDKFFGGAVIVSAQTKGKISAEKFYRLESLEYMPLDEWLEYDAQMANAPIHDIERPPFWGEDEEGDHMGWWRDYYDNRWKEIVSNLGTPNEASTILGRQQGGGGETYPYTVEISYTPWEIVENNVVPTSLFMSSNSPLNTYKPNYPMLTAAPTLLNFIGFFESPYELFGIGGASSWFDIKNNGYDTPPAPEWAYEINERYTYGVADQNGGYYRMDSPNKALAFLQANGYPSAELKAYVCSENNAMNGAISGILADLKPVVIFVNYNHAALAYIEEIQKQTETTTIKTNVNGYIYVNEYVKTYYHSKITYFSGNGNDITTLNSDLNNRMSYIAY